MSRCRTRSRTGAGEKRRTRRFGSRCSRAECVAGGTGDVGTWTGAPAASGVHSLLRPGMDPGGWHGESAEASMKRTRILLVLALSLFVLGSSAAVSAEHHVNAT